MMDKKLLIKTNSIILCKHHTNMCMYIYMELKTDNVVRNFFYELLSKVVKRKIENNF